MDSPNNDREAIRFLLASVSWADECQWIERTRGPRLVTTSYILVPCRWDLHREFHSEARHLAKEFAVEAGGLLLWGASSDSEWERVNEEAVRSGLVIWWAGTTNQVRWSRLASRALNAVATRRGVTAERVLMEAIQPQPKLISGDCYELPDRTFVKAIHCAYGWLLYSVFDDRQWISMPHGQLLRMDAAGRPHRTEWTAGHLWQART